MIFEGKYLDHILRQLYSQLISSTDTFVATKGAGRDLLAATVVLDDPRARLSASVSRGNIVSALGEFCWYLSGCNEIEFMRYYLPEYPPKDAVGKIDEAYGHRLRGTDVLTGRVHDQFLRVIEKLRENQDTRKACISILEASDLAASKQKKREVPCTVALQFIRRRERIHMASMMRSNDAYLGFIHDIFCFTMIQELVARALGVKVGNYHHFATSLHLYEKDMPKAKLYLEEGYQDPSFAMPNMPSGCQLKSLDKFLLVEQKIKTEEIKTADDIKLPSYWKDLALILLQFADRKFNRGNSKRSKSIGAISSEFYQRFFLEKPRIISKSNDDDASGQATFGLENQTYDKNQKR